MLDLPSSDLRGDRDKYMGCIKGRGRGKRERLAGSVRKKRFVNPQSLCVCTEDHRACDLLLLSSRWKVSERVFDMYSHQRL